MADVAKFLDGLGVYEVEKLFGLSREEWRIGSANADYSLLLDHGLIENRVLRGKIVRRFGIRVLRLSPLGADVKAAMVGGEDG